MYRSLIRLADRAGLSRFLRLRQRVKHGWCRLIDPWNRGRLVHLQAGATLRVPTYYASAFMANYEVAAMRAFLAWLRQHPQAVVADVGCSLALYSLAALEVSPSAQVIAFDSDRISLRISLEFCRLADLKRLRFVHGYLTENHLAGVTLDQAATDTAQILADPSLSAEPTAMRYVCLNRDQPEEVIPRYSLDGLLLDPVSSGTPLLVKIDVEGAELLVLRGARQLLLQRRPTLLLSVHPQFLPAFQQSPDDVAAFLREHRYRWQVLSADHEEHWWCEPA